MLEQIWANRMLTNGGPFHQRFTETLSRYLGVEHVSLVANATLGLMLVAGLLEPGCEVITTPFSFVATGHALLWARVTPVFVDIDPRTLNIDPNLIERAITPRTKAILGVHCYGQPCDVEAIEAIGRRHGLQVIYDAAHAFAIRKDGASILMHGDASVLSFHATKVFNTFEGGAIISRDAATKEKLDKLINYGIEDEVTINMTGFNAKMSEFNAALGLLQLQYVQGYIEQRRVVDQRYREMLADLDGIRYVHSDGTQPENYYCFPILVGENFRMTRDELFQRLRDAGIFAKRYFYPILPEFPMYRDLPSAGADKLPVATEIASRVLCLPIYPDLSQEEQARIAAVIRHG